MHRAMLSLLALATALILAAQTPTAPPAATAPAPAKKYNPQPVVQPIPYSHKQHLALGLECKNCHEVPEPGDFAGIPATSKCMACHAQIKKESPAIQRLADYDQRQEAVPWKRVYRIADYVYFSHKIHLASGKATCESCHGQVRQRDVLFKEKDSTSMASCMECHRENAVAITCDFCHEVR